MSTIDTEKAYVVSLYAYCFYNKWVPKEHVIQNIYDKNYTRIQVNENGEWACKSESVENIVLDKIEREERINRSKLRHKRMALYYLVAINELSERDWKTLEHYFKYGEYHNKLPSIFNKVFRELQEQKKSLGKDWYVNTKLDNFLKVLKFKLNWA